MRKLTIHAPVNILGDPFAVAFRNLPDLEENEEVQLVAPNGQEIAYANVLNIWAGPLGAVPAAVCERMQDPLCRSYSGLVASLAFRRENESDQTNPEMTVFIPLLKAKESTILRPTAAEVARGGALRKGGR